MKRVTPWCVLLLKMSGYLRNFDDARVISFLVKGKELLVECDTV